MAAGFQQVTDLYDIYHSVQNTMIRYTKDVFIASLREFFGRDSKYHYVSDSYGYPKTPDHTNLDPNAGLFDDLTTRVFIGEQNRTDIIYYPAVLIKSGSFRSVPISINMNEYVVEYEEMEFYDDSGNRKIISVPSKFVLAGAWEGSISVEIQSRGLRERDDLIELISMYFVNYNWKNFYRQGISIKPDLSISGPNERDDRNDKLYTQTIDVNVRGEWRREIPISNIIDTINFCVEFGVVDSSGNFSPTAPNLDISTKVELQDNIETI